MAVAIAAETGVAILIGCNLDVVLGNSGGFLNGAELGVNQKAELILGGIGNQGIADGTVIGLGIVAADPQLDPGQAVLGVLGQAEVRSIGSHGIDGGLEVGLLLSGERLKSSLEGGGIIVTGEHVQEVLAHDLGINIHEQAVLAFRYKIPNIIIGFFTDAVIHKDLIEGLQGQIAFIGIGGGVVGVSPILGDEGKNYLKLGNRLLKLKSWNFKKLFPS